MKAIATLISQFVFITVICLSSTSNAWSATVSYEANPGGLIPLFDPGLGSLASVLISVDLSEQVSMQVFNSGTETQTFAVSDSAGVTITGAVPVAFSGSYSIDFEADPGVTLSFGVATVIDSYLLDGSNISNFIGLGTFFSTVGNGFHYVDSFAAGLIPNVTPQSGLMTNSSTVGSVAYSYNYIPAVVPVPAAVWLFGTGILGLIGFSKRKAAMLKAA